LLCYNISVVGRGEAQARQRIRHEAQTVKCGQRAGRLTPGAIALALAAALGATAAPRRAEGDGAKLRVVASIAPLADFAREVGGDRVEVEQLVPPGQNPHTYALKPAQMRGLTRARLLVLNGMGLEFFGEKIAEAAGNPDLVVLRTAEGLVAGALGAAAHGAHDHDEEDEADPARNPHVSVDPVYAMAQVERIRAALAALDPAGRAAYEANARRYLVELAALDGEFRAALATVRTRRFIVFHPSFTHLARRYGLEQVAVVSSGGTDQEPLPRRIAAVIETARRLHARAIFAEPQFPRKSAETIAAEAGIAVAYLDPIGAGPRATYLGTMRANLRALVAALQ
jgi:zinc transport system substrate-binding protein